MASASQVVRNLVPPLLWNYSKRHCPRLVRALGGHYTHIQFRGDYPDFAAARAASSGYDAPAILARTREALLKVKRGESRWERDAMVSDSEELPTSLLACLSWIAAQQGRREIRVVDFGGSLGTMYFWCRPFLAPELKLSWTIVEQPEHVRVGRSEFQNDELRFEFSVADALSHTQPDVLLISGVLQFLENPETFLAEAMKWQIPFLVLDRTPMWDLPRHRLTVQTVPPEIYPASYPAWFLSRERIVALLERDYRLRMRIADTETWEVDRLAVRNFLYLFTRKIQPAD